MASAAYQNHQLEETPPLLILHRHPNFKLSFFPLLRSKFTVLDQHDDPPHPSFPALSKAARLLLNVGPTPVTSDVLDTYSGVECVVLTSAGHNHVDLAACLHRGVRVTTSGDSYSDDVADYAVGLAISVLRRVCAANRFVRARSWLPLKEFSLASKVRI